MLGQQHDDAVRVDREGDDRQARARTAPATRRGNFTRFVRRVRSSRPSATDAEYCSRERRRAAQRRAPTTTRPTRRRSAAAREVPVHPMTSGRTPHSAARGASASTGGAADERDAPEVRGLHDAGAPPGMVPGPSGARTRDLGARRMARVQQRDRERVLAAGELGARGRRGTAWRASELHVHERAQRVQRHLFVLSRARPAPQQVVDERTPRTTRDVRRGSAR